MYNNRSIDVLEYVRDIVEKRLNMAASAAAYLQAEHDDEGFNGAMRSVAAFAVVLDDIAVAIQREQAVLS